MVMFTNTTRMTGLAGMDTEDMVRKIMMAESQRLHRLQKRRTSLSWQQDAYRAMASQMNSFQSEFLDIIGPNSIRSSTNMNSKSVTSSNKAVGATITSSAKPGIHEIKVDQLATKDQYTSDKSISTSIIGKETFDHNNLKGGDSFRISLNGEQTKEISFTDAELAEINSNEEFVSALNKKLEDAFGKANDGKPMVEAKLDGGKLSIDTNGTGNTITITEGTVTPSAVDGKNMSEDDWAKLGGKEQTITVNGKDVTVDFTKFNEDNPLTQEQALKLINEALKEEGFGNIQVSANANGDVVFRATGTNQDITLGGELFDALGGTDGTLPRTNTLGALGGIQSGAQNTVGNNTLGDIFKPKEGEADYFDQNGEMNFTINGVSITLLATDTVEQMQNKINNSGAGVTLSYSNVTQKFSLESNREGESNQIRFGGEGNFQEMLGLDHVKGTGTNAKITFNGVAVERQSNNFEIDGIRLQLNSVTDEIITIEVKGNSDKTKQVITDFVEEYNKLIESLNKERTTSRPKTNSGGHYEPLTDEEKKEMSAEEIKKWEEQAKTGLLRGCDILAKTTSDMRMQLNEPITLSDGTTVRLSDFGITTSSNFRDNGKLIIDEEKLDAALSSFTGEQTAEFFGEIGDKLNNTIDNANRQINIRAGAETGLSRTDNALTKRMNEFDNRMIIIERQLARKEEQLFAQFGKMEAAVMQSNSQMDLLFSMLGI